MKATLRSSRVLFEKWDPLYHCHCGRGYTSVALVTHLLERRPILQKKLLCLAKILVMVRLVLCTLTSDQMHAQIGGARPAKPDLFPIWAEACLQDEGAYCEAGQILGVLILLAIWTMSWVSCRIMKM